MSFIKRFIGKEPTDKTRITAEDIESFISQKPPLEENPNLDYKSISAKPMNFDELAKDVSAFANSEGGLLIFGVSEKGEVDQKTKKTIRIYPESITWGEPSLRKETIDQHLVGKIHPPIEDSRVIPIRKSEQDPSVIFLIDVPKSNNAPHMATPYNKYYKRYNFDNLPMGHYEIQNLFRINWIMKEKFIEKIHEPLSKALEKQIKALESYSHLFSHEVEDILSNTYYKNQMPPTLLKQIDNYIRLIKDWDKKMYRAQTAIKQIITKNVSTYLQKAYDQENDKVDVKFRAIAKDSPWDLPEIHVPLLKNQKIKPYLIDIDFRRSYTSMEIIYNNEPHKVDLEKFEEHIWKKCLEESSENAEITKLKESVEHLMEEAQALIERITNS